MKNEHLFIAWTDKFSCGVKAIDEQHKGLVDLINEMHNHVAGNCDQEYKYFKMVIHEAVMYVKNHFATEEKIMLITKFWGYAEHKKEHDGFVRTVVETIHEYEAGKRFTPLHFTWFLKDWVLSHIALMDKQYFEHFRNIATRKADGTLSITINDVNTSH